MQKHALITFNWHDREEQRWLFWLEKKLKDLGYDVAISPLTDSSKKLLKTKEWLAYAQEAYKIPEKNIVIVPHDPGCLTILAYLTKLAQKNIEEPVMLVAGTPKPITSLQDVKQIAAAKNQMRLEENLKNFHTTSSTEISTPIFKDGERELKREIEKGKTNMLALLSEKAESLNIKLVILCSAPKHAPLLQSGRFLVV